MKIEAQATGSTPAHEVEQRAKLVVGVDPAKFGSDSTVIAVHRAGEAPRDVTTDGLLKLVDKLERAHQTQAAIAWQHYQRAQAAEARLDVMETAVADVLRFVSRGDWNNLRPETRAVLEGGKL